MKLVIAAALTAIAALTISVPVLAAYDDFDCRASDSLKNSYLDCISCGAQKFYSDQAKDDREVVPSEKWLAFLAVVTKQTSHLAPSRSDGRFVAKDNDIVVNEEARANLQKKVIAQVQAYGVCTKFRSKKNKSGKDMSSDEWKMIFSYLTTNKNASEAELQKLAEFFGFDNPSFGSRAESNMRYLVTGKRVNPALETPSTRMNDFSEDPKHERRPKFQRRLDDILKSDYDVSGERTSSRSALASGDKSSGLQECLEEIKAVQSGRGGLIASVFAGDSNSYEFCKTMANSCDLPSTGFCAGAPRPALPSATSKPVPDRHVTGKNLPPLQSGDTLSPPLNEGSAHSLDNLPNPKTGKQ